MRLLICIFLLSSSSLFAFEATCNAIVRTSNHKLRVQQVTIKELVSKTEFRGEYFKVVKQKSEEPILIGSRDSLRACTAYYHSTIAKDYFITNYDLKKFKRKRAITLRVEMDLGFEESSHMMHENNGKFYNNAVTIPPSNRSRLTEKPWHYEIWFAPKKKVKMDSSTHKAAQLITSGPFMSSLIVGVGQSQATTIGVDLVRGSTFGADFYTKTLAMSVGITALIPYTLKWVSKPFKKTIYLDTGLIPEVIYHEYSHYALSENISIDTHSPVVEGIANYFAAIIGKTDSILKKTKGYSKGLMEINAKKDKNYEYYMEDSKYAQLDFTFKFLYGLKDVFGEKLASNLVYESSKILGQKNSMEIKADLLSALKTSLKKLDPSKSKQYKLVKLFQKFGF